MDFLFVKQTQNNGRCDFSEVQQPYSEEEVMQEAERCLLCGTPVCIDACPVLLDVRGMNEAAARGDFKTSYERIRETNPLLGVTARCCPQLQGLCEDACVLKWSGQPIGIGLIQRYIADWERKNRQPPVSIEQDTGKKGGSCRRWARWPCRFCSSQKIWSSGNNIRRIYYARRHRMVWGSRLSSA